MQLYLKNNQKTVYIVEQHKRTVFIGDNRFISGHVPQPKLIPRSFIILRFGYQNRFFFGHLDSNNCCHRMGSNYLHNGLYNDPWKFEICLSQTFINFENSIGYFWTSTFYKDFPSIYPTAQMSLSELIAAI